METEPVAQCPVCGSVRRSTLYAGVADVVFRLAPGRWTLVGCGACGCAFLDPRPAAAALAAAYAGAYYTHGEPEDAEAPAVTRAERLRRALRNGYLNARWGYHLAPATLAGRVVVPLLPAQRAWADRVFRHLPAGGRLLDVGCGNGGFVAHAVAAGWTAEGIDTDPVAVAAAQRAGLVVRQEPIEQLAARAPGVYDALTLSHVIEHVPDPVGFLRHAHRLLRPGGRIWVATPNLDALWHRRARALWTGLDVPRHLVLFRRESLVHALEAAGFREPVPQRAVPFAARHAHDAAAMRRGRPIGQPAPLARADAWRARLADALCLVWPELGEELCVVATA